MSYASLIEPAYGPAPTRGRAVGIVVSTDFPDREIVVEAMKRGAEKEAADTVFIIRGKPTASDNSRWAVEALREAGREVILADTNREYWGSGAGRWRDNELLRNCDLVIVFHDMKSATTGYFVDHVITALHPEKVKVITRGKPKALKRKRGRKPAGV